MRGDAAGDAKSGALIRPWRGLVALAIAAIAGCAVDAPRTVTPSDEATIREMETKSWVAWKNSDAAFFEQLLSEDHVDVHSVAITGKAAVVAGVKSAACVVKNYSIGPMSLTRVSADAVLLTYRAEQDTSCGPHKVPSPVWATSLYARRDGRWVQVMYQHTPVAR